MNLHENQKIIARDTHRFRVVNCGRRFGKTILACEEMIGVAVSKNDRRVVYYAPTREDAREIMWGILTKRCEPITTYRNDSRLELQVRTQEGGTSTITLYGWKALQEQGKGRGQSFNFVVLDEVASYRNFWVGWEEVLSPTLIDNKGSALFISTPKGFNHFYDLYNMEAKNQDYQSFHFTSYDNPHIPHEELEREKATKPENTFAQEYMADFRKAEGLVYKEFDRKVHVSDKEPTRVTDTIVVCDWGHTNPAAVYRIRIDGDRRYFIDSEFYRRGQSTDKIIEYAKSLQGTKFYPDPAEPDRLEIAEQAGLNVRTVNKSKPAGIDKVREVLKQGRLFVHPSCKNLILEFETYHYEDNRRDGNEKEEPVKENDHAMDAIRYGIYMQEIGAQDSEYAQFENYQQEEYRII